MQARAETAAQRIRILHGLRRRNRLVGILRLAVPALGVVVLGGLVLPVLLTRLVPDFGFADIAIDRDMLVVQDPSYNGMAADGTGYAVAARSARAPIGRTDRIELTDAVLTVRRPVGGDMTARAALAQLATATQVVRVEGLMQVAEAGGVHGTLRDVTASLAEETLDAAGAVAITFANGAVLESAALTYDGAARTWTFQEATLTLPTLPGAGAAAEGGLLP